MPDTPELIERVARAITKRNGGEWYLWLDEARDAIEAMREPGEAMLGAIHDKVRIECRPDERSAYITNADQMWAAGIDAALAAPEEGREP